MARETTKEPPRGSRGGRTAGAEEVSHIRKTYLLPAALEDAIHEEVVKTGRPESDIICEQLSRRYSDLAGRTPTAPKKPAKKKPKPSED